MNPIFPPPRTGTSHDAEKHRIFVPLAGSGNGHNGHPPHKNGVNLNGSKNQTTRHAGQFPEPVLRPTDKPEGITIGWINRWPHPEKAHACRDFNLCWLGARAAAKDFGHKLETISYHPSLPIAGLHARLKQSGIRTLLLPPQPPSLSWDGFPWDEYTVVNIGHTHSAPHTHLVASNQIENTLECVTRIRALGYERLGIITSRPLHTHAGLHFQAGCLMARQQMPDFIRIPDFTTDTSASPSRDGLLRTWLDAYKPDAILTNVPGLRKKLSRIHTRVPENIAIAVTNVLTDGADTGIHQHPLEIGRTAVELLHSVVSATEHTPHSHPTETFIRGSWLDGRSMPPRHVSPFPAHTIRV